MSGSTSRGPLVRPGFLRVSVVVLIVLCPFVVYTAWDYVESWREAGLLAQIDPTGTIVTPPGVRLQPDEMDAERLYRAAGALASDPRPEVLERMNRVAAAARVDEWPPAAIADLTELDRENADALSLAERAAPLSFKQYAPGYTSNYFAASINAVQRLMGYRALLRTLRGDDSGASDALYAETRAALTIDGSIGFPVWLGSDLVQVLERVKNAPDSLARLESALRALDTAYDRSLTLWYERAVYRLAYDSRSPRSAPSTPFLGVLERPWTTHVLNGDLEILSKLLPASREGWPRRIDAVIGVGHVSGVIPRNVTEHEFLEGFVVGMASRVAVFRCARVVVAVERYKHDHGQLPAAVDALVPAYIAPDAVDPFSGTSLLLKPTGDGYIVYSVGTNRRDDGGAISGGPVYIVPKEPPADVGVRVRYHQALP